MKMNKILASMAAAAISVSAFAAMTISASADEEPTTDAAATAAAVEHTFTLGGKLGDKTIEGQVKADKDGEYSIKFEGAASNLTADNFALYLAADINKDEYKDAAVTIDEVTVDGKAVEYKQSENAVSYSTDGNEKIKIAIFEGDIKDIEVPAAVAENVSVKFTVKNAFAKAEEETTTAAEETTTTTAEETTTTTTETTTTTTATTTTTTKAAATTTKSGTESAAKTGDAGAAVAVAVLGVAAAAAVTLRKKD